MRKATPHLESITAALIPEGTVAPGVRRCSFDSLELLQTPGVWGQDCAAWSEFLTPAGRRLLECIEETVASGTRLVDISSLEPYASGHFLDAIARGLERMAACGERTTVRILFGNNPYSRETNESLVEMLRRLTRNLDPGTSLLTIHACRMFTCIDGLKSSWNHAKIVAADGRRCIVGGHNLWSGDYFAGGPVHDLSAILTGQGAIETHLFLNRLWEWVGNNLHNAPESPHAFAVGWKAGVISEGSTPAHIDLDAGAGGRIPALALARYGYGVRTDEPLPNPASGAAAAAFRLAQRSILISQMDFALRWNGPSVWPDQVMEVLIDGLTDPGKQLDVKIIVTEPDGLSGSGGHYSFGETPQGVIEEFRKRIGPRPLTGSLMIAPIRFRRGIDAWEVEGKKIKVTTHAKLWMIDGQTFHVGSDNIYPHNLQEFGYVIEDPEVAAGVIRDYWNPLWENSSAGALPLNGS